MTQTPVIFRKWRTSEGGIIALFPAIPADVNGLYCSSYQHVGQHGSANYTGVIARTRPATRKEYAALKRELESDPYTYKLQVCDRRTAQHVRDFKASMQSRLSSSVAPAVPIARIEEIRKLFASEEISEENGALPQMDDNDKKIVEMATCGECGKSWNDALISSSTPVPSGRCPYESIHEELAELRALQASARVAPGLPANAAYYIAEARKLATDELEIDDNPEVSPGDGGAFVAAWVWIPSGGLKTEQFNFSMQTRVCDAFKASEIYETLDIHHIHAAFEHGQWWIIATMNEGNESDQITYSVVDAEGGDSVNGFDFEEVSK